MSRTMSSIGLIVRRKRKMPLGPRVSPTLMSIPYFLGISMSCRQTSVLPDRIVVRTTSAPLSASARSSVAATFAGRFPAATNFSTPFFAHSSRSASMSMSEIVASSKSGKVRMSRTSSLVKPRLPAPMNVILVIESPGFVIAGSGARFVFGLSPANAGSSTSAQREAPLAMTKIFLLFLVRAHVDGGALNASLPIDIQVACFGNGLPRVDRRGTRLQMQIAGGGIDQQRVDVIQSVDIVACCRLIAGKAGVSDVLPLPGSPCSARAEEQVVVHDIVRHDCAPA